MDLASYKSTKIFPKKFSGAIYFTKWFIIIKMYPKMFAISCANSHHDVITFRNDGMFWNIKSWISQEQNLIFPWNENY